MDNFLTNFKNDLQEIWKKLKEEYAKLTKKPVSKDGSVVSSSISTTYEINLVPEVKAQMIKAQRMRNMVLFICIVVSSVAVGAVVILFGIKSGQDIAMSNQDGRLELMSSKLNEYTELDDIVTIQAQLQGISNILGQKTVLSRVFGAMGAMLPQGDDDVTLSQLRADMATNIVTMEGQADARTAPLIDYRVLESFKKGVELTKYDFGRYVDIDGKELPTACISEADASGQALKEGNSYYAWWDLTTPGCEGVVRSLLEDADIEYHYSANAEVEMGYPGYETTTEIQCHREDDKGNTVEEGGEEVCEEVLKPVVPTVVVDGEEVPGEVPEPTPIRVKIWRTPQFTEWYEEGLMSTDGQIDGVEHFMSECYNYKGNLVGESVRWTSTNDCLLAPDGLEITSSANGRDESDNLVLRFTATVTFSKEFFKFANKHMIAIGPMGQNVTDSYVQIGNMFAQEARACDANDTECLSNSSNSGGN